jgi:hypothetical protein
MINRHSFSAWMLVDVLGVLLLAGGLFGAGLLLAFAGDAGQQEVVIKGLRERAGELEQSRQVIQADVRDKSEFADECVRKNKELHNMVDRLTAEIRSHQADREQEGYLRQELLGLQGNLRRTAFLIDCSASMSWPLPSLSRVTQSDSSAPASPDEVSSEEAISRWQVVLKTVVNWIEHLPIEELKVLCFSDDVREYPAGDQFLVVNARRDSRTVAIQFLKTTRPKGGTHLVTAMEAAFRQKPTSIVLFTDGAPNYVGNKFDPNAAADVIRLCETEGKGVPVNVVALGDYFETAQAAFLIELAQMTGGSFRAL